MKKGGFRLAQLAIWVFGNELPFHIVRFDLYIAKGIWFSLDLLTELLLGVDFACYVVWALFTRTLHSSSEEY